MEATHDLIVNQQGIFAKAMAGIRAAVRAGFQVCTNTTIYRQTDMHEIAVLPRVSFPTWRGRDDDLAGLWLPGRTHGCP